MFDIIFDRDGILNVDIGYTYRIEDCVLPDHATEALILLRDAGARFSIATGQSGIARGKYTEEDMKKFNKYLLEQFTPHGITFAAIAFCPHHPDITGDCDCRKPKTEMLRQIEKSIGPIDWPRAWGIGDKPSDAEMILAMGGRSVLVRSGPHNNRTGEVYWKEDDPALKDLLQNPRNFIADSLLQAAQIITSKTS
jgi:D-glycero-D-manno-heptose 1,7-bisphosphate phosphatase